ncbi:MAG: hypothetical protein FWG50_06565 [Kiritimatiellaeota bacterium]|nr:hypothetical protein [Kiritimatiellota bacterium]
MNKEEIARLEQRNLGRGKQSFILREDGTLLVTILKGRNLQHFSVSLAGWNPEPIQEKNTPKLFDNIVFAFVSVLLAVCFVGLFIASFDAPVKTIGGLMMYFGLLAVWWLTLLDKFLHRKDIVLIFRNPMTGAWIALFDEKPNAKDFSSFVEALKATIRRFANAMPERMQTKTIDLCEFTRLRDEGILTGEELEEIKRKFSTSMPPAESVEGASQSTG